MKSLFYKIFLWFWLAQILLGFALFAVFTATRAVTASQNEPVPRRFRALAGDALAFRAHNAASFYAAGGPTALKAYLAHTDKDTRWDLYAYDARGNLLAGQAAADAERLGQRALYSGHTEWITSDDESLFARVGQFQNVRLALVARSHRPQHPDGPGGFWHDLERPSREGILRMLVLFSVSSLVCYGLARYLASPTTVLRDATHRLANGDLKTRVAPQMGRRRDELADLGRDFDIMAERIESLLSAERRLLGDISHELRSPLARLNVALDLADNGDNDEYLNRIRRESGRLNELIGQLLALTRLESGASGARWESFNLCETAREVVGDADFEAQSLNRQVSLSDCADTEAILRTFRGNANLLRSAIENVVRNAVRHTAENTTVEVGISRKDTNAILRVRDHGTGVPEESLDKLFQPFYRVEEARDRQSGGAGLGLAIAQRAVRFHGGEISARNALDGGLIVEMTLPLEKGKPSEK